MEFKPEFYVYACTCGTHHSYLDDRLGANRHDLVQVFVGQNLQQEKHMNRDRDDVYLISLIYLFSISSSTHLHEWAIVCVRHLHRVLHGARQRPRVNDAGTCMKNAVT